MAHFLVATIPVVGHVAPMLPIVEQLVRLGYEVWWYTGQLFQSQIEATGAYFAPMQQDFDYSITAQVPTALTEKRQTLKGLAQLKFDLENFFIKPAIGNTQDLLSILERFPADVILADSFFLAASWVHEAGGPPWAQLGVPVLTLPSSDTAPWWCSRRR